MREIKFRGETKQGNWVYGYYLPWHAVKTEDRLDVYAQIFEEKDEKHAKGWVFVKANTVGQYTGLKDKNGVEIYEGDIVKIFDYIIGEVTFEKGTFGVGFIKDIDYELLEEYLSSYKGYNDDWYGCNNSNFISFYEIYSNCNDLDCIEVIGNIYDNPELLEVEE